MFEVATQYAMRIVSVVCMMLMVWRIVSAGMSGSHSEIGRQRDGPLNACSSPSC